MRVCRRLVKDGLFEVYYNFRWEIVQIILLGMKIITRGEQDTLCHSIVQRTADALGKGILQRRGISVDMKGRKWVILMMRFKKFLRRWNVR